MGNYLIDFFLPPLSQRKCYMKLVFFSWELQGGKENAIFFCCWYWYFLTDTWDGDLLCFPWRRTLSHCQVSVGIALLCLTLIESLIWICTQQHWAVYHHRVFFLKGWWSRFNVAQLVPNWQRWGKHLFFQLLLTNLDTSCGRPCITCDMWCGVTAREAAEGQQEHGQHPCTTAACCMEVFLTIVQTRNLEAGCAILSPYTNSI